MPSEATVAPEVMSVTPADVITNFQTLRSYLTTTKSVFKVDILPETPISFYGAGDDIYVNGKSDYPTILANKPIPASYGQSFVDLLKQVPDILDPNMPEELLHDTWTRLSFTNLFYCYEDFSPHDKLRLLKLLPRISPDYTFSNMQQVSDMRVLLYVYFSKAVSNPMRNKLILCMLHEHALTGRIALKPPHIRVLRRLMRGRAYNPPPATKTRVRYLIQYLFKGVGPKHTILKLLAQCVPPPQPEQVSAKELALKAVLNSVSDIFVSGVTPRLNQEQQPDFWDSTDIQKYCLPAMSDSDVAELYYSYPEEIRCNYDS
jgi:hypothetical protein